MKHWKLIFQVIVFCLLSPYANHVLAQQTRVDSVLAMLKESMPNDKLDSIKLQEAADLIAKSKLNEEQITSIEKQATLLDRGADQDRSFHIKSRILGNLGSSDYERGISYGQKILQEVEASKSPHKRIIRDLILSLLRIPYRNSNRLEEGIKYYNSRIKDLEETNDSSGLATIHYVLSGFYNTTGLADEAIYHLKKSNTYTNEDPDYDRTFFNARERNSLYFETQNLSVISKSYFDKGDTVQALSYGVMALEKAKELGYSGQIPYLISNVVIVKLATNNLENIPELLKSGSDISVIRTNTTMRVVLMQLEAEYNIKTNDFGIAESILNECWRLVMENNHPVNSSSGTINPDYYLALLRIAQNRLKEAIILLDKDIIRLGNFRQEKLKDYALQATLYEQLGDYKNAFLVNKKYLNLRNEIQSDIDKFRRVSFEVEQEMNQKELSISALQAKNKISSIIQKFTIGLAIMFIFLAASIYYRFQSKKKANAILEATLSNLKSTQSQLIQSEKMASLGELTAGIAHEIQNPLNFVNNFSEVNSELIDEQLEEIEKGDLEEVKELAHLLKENSSKIALHGKRADAIVKGMLEHSKRGSGQKEPTDLNALADDFLRMTYQSFLAKDPNFKVELQTNLDPDLPKISVIPQDIGKVLLNLYSNAFYACGQLGHTERSRSAIVTVSTSYLQGGRGVEISVKDNGPGIPESIKDKIFQPFFTTKKGTEGTGLGLSLSYDIVKAHGGELRLETKVGVGTEFMIILPIQNHI
jgi:signal transduction histidine kinase/tetratricopeptide (TPR) repeat protein